jgi:hypothetical protein
MSAASAMSVPATVSMATIPITAVVAVIIIPWPVMIADAILAAAPPPVTGVPVAMIIKMIIRPWFIDHHFVATVEIVTAVPSRQAGGKYPAAGIEVDELFPGNVIISFHIGQVIIVGPVISYGTPLWLCSDIYTYAYLCVGLHRSEGASCDQ